jgi:tetratricopeptide (TPR) repeat protein
VPQRARIGAQRAEIIAHNALINALVGAGETDRAAAHVERPLALARGLGARRFEGTGLYYGAIVHKELGRRSVALDLARQALAISREAGINFAGPWILGFLAVTTDNAAERDDALAEGEAILQRGAVGHNHLWFRRYAIEAHLKAEDWIEAERHAQALEDYTSPEALPWADYFIAHGRRRPFPGAA